MLNGQYEDVDDLSQTDIKDCVTIWDTGSHAMGAQKCMSRPICCSGISKLTLTQPQSLSASGADMVYTQAIFAIVGALALEKGGAVANKVAKERILEPLGMKRTETGGKR